MGLKIEQGERAILRVSLGRPIVTNWDFMAYSYSLPRGLATQLFPNYFEISCLHC